MHDPTSATTPRRWTTTLRAVGLGAALLAVALGCVALIGAFVVAVG